MSRCTRRLGGMIESVEDSRFPIFKREREGGLAQKWTLGIQSASFPFFLPLCLAHEYLIEHHFYLAAANKSSITIQLEWKSFVCGGTAAAQWWHSHYWWLMEWSHRTNFSGRLLLYIGCTKYLGTCSDSCSPVWQNLKGLEKIYTYNLWICESRGLQSHSEKLNLGFQIPHQLL